MVVCRVCQRIVGIVTAWSMGSTNRRGTVRRSIVSSMGTAKQTIILRREMTSLMIVVMRITTGTPTIDPNTAIGTLTGSCIVPSLARVGSIWHKRP
jgi:hypothetical protein